MADFWVPTQQILQGDNPIIKKPQLKEKLLQVRSRGAGWSVWARESLPQPSRGEARPACGCVVFIM